MATKFSLRTAYLKSTTRNKIIASSAGIVVAVAGYVFFAAHASSGFASVEAETATPTAPAMTIIDKNASAGKGLQFGAGVVAPPPPNSPSGQPMPVGDLPGWHQVFTDDFTTNVPVGGFSGCQATNNILTSSCSGLPPAVGAKWFAYPDGWTDTSGIGIYSPSKVISIQNGVMNFYLHTENGTHMVAAPEPKIPGATGPGGGMQYGRYAIRFKADQVPGYASAWLLWPDSETWPRDGEIDFPEGTLTQTINAYMHHQNGITGDQDAYPTTAPFNTWHTAVIEWGPSQCRFMLDGAVIGTSTQNIPNTAMHWVLQTETAYGATPAAATTGNVQIDWVTAYARQ